jgi:hypothetical protein
MLTLFNKGSRWERRHWADKTALRGSGLGALHDRITECSANLHMISILYEYTFKCAYASSFWLLKSLLLYYSIARVSVR